MVKKATKISPTEVKKVAVLARLDLTDDELAMYSEQLSAILTYIEQLAEVDTENVEITTQVTGLSNVTRPDKVAATDESEQLIKMAPASKNNLVKVKAVFE